MPLPPHLSSSITQKYRGMGSLEAMTKGSESRYYGDTQALKIAQGVSGTVRDKGSIRRTVPFMVQAVKQGFQDLGAKDLKEVRGSADERIRHLGGDLYLVGIIHSDLTMAIRTQT